jgi:acetoin utilization deacetylase AcuC-like enzyme
LVPYFEKPERIESILSLLSSKSEFDITKITHEFRDETLERIREIHDLGYLEWLEYGYSEAVEKGAIDAGVSS